MMQRLSRLYGGPVRARDGDVGTIRDFYFDEDTWTVRHLIVDTGKWLRGRLVLIPLWALEQPERAQAHVPVRLSRDQVRNSPDIDTQKPVSRRAEAAALAYYQYPFYWGGPALWGPVAAPAAIGALPPPELLEGAVDEAETHLRSCREVSGYRVEAHDGEIGLVDDFVIEDSTWRIDQLLIDKKIWFGGRFALISPSAVDRISWADKRVFIRTLA